MDLRVIGKNIRKKRLTLGYTQEKLAEIANCSWRYIPAIEQGLRIPSLKWLNQLAENLNIPLIEFLRK
jgi:transcriptional regulator with XRE-family HTH domain